MKSQKSEAIQKDLKEMVGIVKEEMNRTIREDMVTILSRKTAKNEKNVEAAMDGYVLAISRLMETNLAWMCLLEAYHKCKQEVPHKYFKIFNVQPGESQPTISTPVWSKE